MYLSFQLHLCVNEACTHMYCITSIATRDVVSVWCGVILYIKRWHKRSRTKLILSDFSNFPFWCIYSSVYVYIYIFICILKYMYTHIYLYILYINMKLYVCHSVLLSPTKFVSLCNHFSTNIFKSLTGCIYK